MSKYSVSGMEMTAHFEFYRGEFFIFIWKTFKALRLTCMMVLLSIFFFIYDVPE